MENKGKFVTRSALFFRKYISSVWYLRDCKKNGDRDANSLANFLHTINSYNLLVIHDYEKSIKIRPFLLRNEKIRLLRGFKFLKRSKLQFYKVFLPYGFLKCWQRNEIKKEREKKIEFEKFEMI